MPKALSSSEQAQSLQRTPSWTNPLKFLQNTRFKGFLTNDKKRALEKPPAHAPLHDKIDFHLDNMEKKRGDRSLSHITDSAPLHHKISHHLDSLEKRTGKRSLTNLLGTD